MLGVGREGPVAAARPAPEPMPVERASGASIGGAARAEPPSVSEREAVAVLASVHDLGPATLGALLAVFGSAAALLELARGRHGAERLRDGWRDHGPTRSLEPAIVTAICAAAERPDTVLAPIHAEQLTLLTLDDPDYPPRLRAIELPPPLLFVRGRVSAMSEQRAVAVVGTRRPTETGRRIATRIASVVARAGAAVVSGLAVGIDGSAHAAVVRERGTTVAVLGGGHARLFPRAHRLLADEIVDLGGVVVSELPPWTGPDRWTFPRRNRIIAGLAESTVVIEAGTQSGALITAAWALEQGRGCFLVPGSLDAPASRGCLAFLRECHGVARIVAGVPELLDDLGLTDASRASSRRGRPSSRSAVPSADAALAEVGAAAASVGRALIAGRASVDEVVAVTDLPVATGLAALTILEDRGLVTGAYGRYHPDGALALAEPRRVRRAATS
jgi:DNA processing protein